MAINVGDNFSYQGKKFLDNRQSFKTLTELQAYSSVPDGFLAYCEENKKRYEFVDGVWTEYIIASETYVDELIESHTHEEYLTEHQDISHLATQTFVNEQISQIEPGMSDSEREQMNKNTNDISTILSIIDTPPTYTKPTLSIGFNTSTLEHNKQSSVVITPTFKQNDAGSVTGYILYRDDEEIFNGESASSFTDTITMSHNTSTTYNATVTYGDGSIKNTLLGVPYPNTSIKAGSVSSTGTIKAYALSYYGVIDTSTITENDISSLSSRLGTNKSFTNTVDLTRQRIVYMYPQSFGTLTSIKDANNFDYINSYTRTSLTYNSVDYYVYILTDPVTITGFKQIYN